MEPRQAATAESIPEVLRDRPDGADLWERVRTYGWYHTIDLGGGLVTQAKFDHRPLLQRYHIPERLDGRRALDVATFDGFWAFEMEKRGAREVIATDLEKVSDLDLPPAEKKKLIQSGEDRIWGEGFNLAKQVLGSRVERKVVSVYDLAPELVGGTFDFVFCGDLLLHLTNPARALQHICSVTSGEARLVDVYDPYLDKIYPHPITRYMGGKTLCTWWNPSRSCLIQMVKDAGFSQVEVLEDFQLAEKGGDQLWRAVIRARP